MFITNDIRAKLGDKAATIQQKDIAESVGVTPTTVTKWLSRKITQIRGGNAKRLCDYLGIDYETEVRRQNSSLNHEHRVNIVVAGDNSGTAILKEEGNKETPLQPADIVRKIMASNTSDAEKIVALRVLTKAGII